ncbi:MAG: hypothetical protein AAFX53_08475 [Bacteroidota bacterium]
MSLIEKGEIHTAFRKWTRPSVRESGTLLTPVGQLRITSLTSIAYDQISDEDIKLAGYTHREELDKELAFKEKGHIYKIGFKRESADPRIELRERTNISPGEMTTILNTLKRYDNHGKVKDWTLKILDMVDADPGKYAVEYATRLGYEKEWFKPNIRKLKNLGLTISLPDGYTISPRGKVVLKALQQYSVKKGNL